MSPEELFVKNERLDAHEWRGLLSLKSALSDFEPLAKRTGLGFIIADRLVAKGLAEKGNCSARYQSIGMTTGYRLSVLGWTIADRGRWPRR